MRNSQFAKSEVKFVGHFVGSGWRRADNEQIDCSKLLHSPETKRQVKFSYINLNIPHAAEFSSLLPDRQITSIQIIGHGAVVGMKAQECRSHLSYFNSLYKWRIDLYNNCNRGRTF